MAYHIDIESLVFNHQTDYLLLSGIFIHNQCFDMFNIVVILIALDFSTTQFEQFKILICVYRRGPRGISKYCYFSIRVRYCSRYFPKSLHDISMLIHGIEFKITAPTTIISEISGLKWSVSENQTNSSWFCEDLITTHIVKYFIDFNLNI